MVGLLPALEDLPAVEFAREVELRGACEGLVVVVLRRTVLLCLVTGAGALEEERVLDTEGDLGALLGAAERAGALEGAGRLTLAGALGAVRAEVLGAAERAGALDGAGRLTLAGALGAVRAEVLGAVERAGALEGAGRLTLDGALGALRAEVLGAALGAEETCLDDVFAWEVLSDLLACAEASMAQRARINTAIITDFLILSLFMIASFL